MVTGLFVIAIAIPALLWLSAGTRTTRGTTVILVFAIGTMDLVCDPLEQSLKHRCERGNFVTAGGSMWHCEQASKNQRPDNGGPVLLLGFPGAHVFELTVEHDLRKLFFHQRRIANLTTR